MNSSSAIWQFSIAPSQLLLWLAPLLFLLAIVIRMGTLKRWAVIAAMTTLVLIMLGAYVRLSDAGLGCPDWPGCYGHLAPTSAADKISAEVAKLPDGPVTLPKAWKEMVHRYLATVVGVLIVGMLVKAIRRNHRQVAALSLILVVVVLQGLFGKWTVTLLLKPAIVTGHLLGGMLLLGLLVWLWQRQLKPPRYLDPELIARLRPAALVVLGLLAMQIALGGWTSTNYAALACTDLPLCQGSLAPNMNFSEGFQLIRPLGKTSEGALISMPALTAIHWTHRMGALIVTLALGCLGVLVARAGDRQLAALLHALLATQILLGFANIWFSLPLPVAVLHNGVAGMLLATLVVLNVRVHAAGRKV
jgi:heme a synthase